VVDFSFDDEGRPLAVLESGQLLTWSWTTSDGGATADLKLVEVEGLTDVVRVEEHLIWRADGSVVRWTPKGGIVPIAGVADATRVRCDMVVCWAVFPDGRVAAGGIENTVYSMVPQITAATDAIPGLGMDLDALVLEGSSARRVYVALPGHPEWRGPDRHWFVVQPAEVPDFAVDTGRCGLNAAGQPKCLPTTRLDGPDAHQRLRGLGGGLRLLSVAGGDACAVRGGSEVTCVAFAPDRDGAPTRIPL
jgi:hypothetical protein